jgi:8-amino-7-oxononanoate synthase
MKKFQFIEDELIRRDEQHQRRVLRNLSPISPGVVQVGNQQMTNFSSNDYLGLAMHPLLRERAAKYSNQYGAGSTSSRLVSGAFDCIADLEQKLAALKGSESTLTMNTGYQTNLTLIPALTHSNSVVFSDALNHNSIIQGIKLAQCGKMIYEHNNLDHLEKLLAAQSADCHKVVVTESVFSMDGDKTDIDHLKNITDQHDALLIVDEAHATGLYGERGMGLTVGKNIDVTMGTFGKALGVFGAYVATSYRIRDYLINCCPGVIYSTALPPAVIGAVDAALELVPGMDEDRQRLQEMAEYVRQELQQLGFDTGVSCTQIIPVLLNDETRTLQMSAQLESAGLLATAIRPPTVPPGGSRIRLALSSAHTDSQIEQLVNALKKVS